MTGHQLKVESAMYRKFIIRCFKRDMQEYSEFLGYIQFLQYRFSVDYDPFATGYAGFSFFLSFAMRFDLQEGSHYLDLEVGKRECQFPISTWAVGFVSKYVLGFKHYTDFITAVTRDEHLRDEIGFVRVPTDRAMSRAQEGIHPRLMKRFYVRFLVKLQKSGQLKGRLIAIDSTFLITYGKTYIRVGRSYNPKGKKGYRLQIAFDCESKLPIMFLLHKANRVDSKMLIRSISEVERILGKNKDRIYMFDKGYWSGANFNQLNNLGIQFITIVKWYSNIAQTLDEQIAFKKHQKYTEATLDGQSVKGYEKTLRVIAIKDKSLLEKEAQKEEVDDTSDEIKDGKERPFCLLTNIKEMTPQKIARIYRTRWNIEEFIREAKQNWNLGHFNNTEHNAIKTHIYFLFYSYGLFQCFRKKVLNQYGIDFAITRTRKHIFIRSGKWSIDSNGQTIIYFNQYDPYDEIILHLINDYHKQQFLQFIVSIWSITHFFLFCCNICYFMVNIEKLSTIFENEKLFYT